MLKARYPKLDVGYYLPTYDLVKRVGYPSFLEVMEAMGVRGSLHKSDRMIEVDGAGSVIFRSMDRPERIVGYKHADFIADELDTLKIDEARKVWNKMIARNRQKKPDGAVNTGAVATTPEGFRFVYDRWKKSPAQGYQLIRASTYSNARNLPDDYIPSLRDSYPSNLLLAYLEGQFVNLTAGSVYPSFDRHKNDTREQIKQGEPLHVGMDFNVNNMSAAIHVQRDGEPHAVDELVQILDTPAMIKVLKDRYQDKGHPILVYPDASGGGRDTNNASVSDISLLKAAKFSVCAHTKNPMVKDRVLAASTMINKDGVRRYRVSQDRCPHLVEALEKQAYDKNGEPDKSSGHDHIIDAATYYIEYRWPIKRPAAVITSLRM